MMHWWQVRKPEENGFRAGLIPGKQLQERWALTPLRYLGNKCYKFNDALVADKEAVEKGFRAGLMPGKQLHKDEIWPLTFDPLGNNLNSDKWNEALVVCQKAGRERAQGRFHTRQAVPGKLRFDLWIFTLLLAKFNFGTSICSVLISFNLWHKPGCSMYKLIHLL